MTVVVRRPRHAEALTHVGEAVVNEVAYKVIGRTVERQAALISGGDELHAPQQRQLMARDGQRQIQRAREISDAQLVVRERVDDAEAHRARQDPEHLDGVEPHIFGGQSGAGRGHFPSIDELGQRMSRRCLHSCEVYQLSTCEAILALRVDYPPSGDAARWARSSGVCDGAPGSRSFGLLSGSVRARAPLWPLRASPSASARANAYDGDRRLRPVAAAIHRDQVLELLVGVSRPEGQRQT